MGRTRPNVVWLLTDHHAFQHHVAQPGPAPAVPTYRRIAAEGIEFTRAAAVCPLCTPARASMLTGVYPHRHGMVMNNGDCGSRLDFEPDARLFSHYLREAGYRCGYFGKWHVGEVRGPWDYGFEGWSQLGYGHAYWDEAYAATLDELGLPSAEVDVEWHFADPRRRGRYRLEDEPNEFYHMESAGVLTTPVETHEAFFVSHLACRWLEERARDGEPFCLRVDVWGPHQPYFVGAPFAGSVDPEAIPEYPSFGHDLADRPRLHQRFRDGRHKAATLEHDWAAWQPVVARCYEHVTQVDAALGRVLDTLDLLGLAEDTLVIYTADHGDAVGSQGGVFDKDSLMVEETERIPLALRWPGVLPAGSATDALVTNMDLVPTLLDAAGADLPPMDGASLLPVARDPAAPWRDDLMCQHHGHGHPAFQRLLYWDRYKLVAHLDDRDELYDLKSDPHELRNRIDDPALGDVLREARERLARQMAACEDDGDDARRLLADLA